MNTHLPMVHDGAPLTNHDFGKDFMQTRPSGARAVLLFLAVVSSAASPALVAGQSAIVVPDVAVTLVDVAPLRAARTDRPAWVVGDVPDTVWILVEAAVAAPEEDEMKQLLRDAEALAREGTVGQEDNVGRRFALAAVLGMRADREGGRTKVAAASGMHDELVDVLALDPDHAQARFMMGRLHAGVRRMNRVTRWLATNILGGSTLKQATWELAEEHLRFAETEAPEVPDHHLQLARLYRDTDRPDLANVELEHVLALPAVSPMEEAARAEAIRLQAEWLDDG